MLAYAHRQPAKDAQLAEAIGQVVQAHPTWGQRASGHVADPAGLAGESQPHPPALAAGRLCRAVAAQATQAPPRRAA